MAVMVRRTQLLVAAAAIAGAVAIITATGNRSDDSSSASTSVSAIERSQSGTAPAAASKPLAVGAIAPVVELVSTSGTAVNLEGFRGKRAVLLYFYEHAG